MMFTVDESFDVLETACHSVPSIDVSCCDETQLTAMTTLTRRLQRRLDGLIVRVGMRADELAVDGESAPAGEMLRDRGSVGAGQARRDAARAKAAGVVPGLGKAMTGGEISGEHVDVINRLTKDLTEEQCDRLDMDDLIEEAKTLPVETFTKLLKRLVDGVVGDHGLADTKAKQAASGFRSWFDEKTQMGRFSGALDPERFEAMINAIDHRASRIAAASDGDISKDANLSAQALVELVTGIGSDVRSGRPLVTVFVDHDTIVHGAHENSVRQTENGCDVPPESIARLCCDATIQRVMRDKHRLPVNVGRKHRTATDAQWAALRSMYDCCGWRRCTAPLSWCQAHHIKEWDKEGPTDLANLIPLCSQHHHRVHEGQWSIKLLRDRRLQILKPDGTHHATVPAPKRC